MDHRYELWNFGPPFSTSAFKIWAPSISNVSTSNAETGAHSERSYLTMDIAILELLADGP